MFFLLTEAQNAAYSAIKLPCLDSSEAYIREQTVIKRRYKWNSDQQNLCNVIQNLCDLIQDLCDINTGKAGERHLEPPLLDSESLRLRCGAYTGALSPRDSITHAYRIYRTLCSTLHSWTVHNSDTLTKYCEALSVDKLKPSIWDIKAAGFSLPSSSKVHKLRRTMLDQQGEPTPFQINIFGKPGLYTASICVSLLTKGS